MDRERTALLFAFLLLGVSMAAATTYPPVEDLDYTCTYEGAACMTTSDVTSGICRSMRFATEGGPLDVQVCHKDGNRYELYRQTTPTGDYQVCVEDGCIDPVRGFASFTMGEVPPGNDTYTYVDPSTFSTSCTLDGETCTKLSDVTSGTCRTVLYDTTGDTEEDLGLLLCHKGDSRYELYRVFYPEGDLYASIGPGFVDWIKGYDSFVVTTPVTPPPPPPPPPPVNETCMAIDSVHDLNPTCDGNITSDVAMGTCRQIHCAAEDGHLTVLACDKPDWTPKEFFEMYRQEYSGEPVTICLDEYCLDGDLQGFQRSADFCTE